jgi:hypothetical protein
MDGTLILQLFIAVCAFSAQAWAYYCWVELRKLNASLAPKRSLLETSEQKV